jgi:ArsR family transcriptional regulator
MDAATIRRYLSGPRPGDLITVGDPTRARILRLIRESDEGRVLVGRLAEVLGLRQPTVSHHMKALHEGGIVVREPEGRRVSSAGSPDR